MEWAVSEDLVALELWVDNQAVSRCQEAQQGPLLLSLQLAQLELVVAQALQGPKQIHLQLSVDLEDLVEWEESVLSWEDYQDSVVQVVCLLPTLALLERDSPHNFSSVKKWDSTTRRQFYRSWYRQTEM